MAENSTGPLNDSPMEVTVGPIFDASTPEEEDEAAMEMAYWLRTHGCNDE